MTGSKRTSSTDLTDQVLQETPVIPVPSVTSNLPPSIISDLIMSMIESLEPSADMWPWFKNLTLVCRGWSAEARRLEFLRISLSGQYPNITRKLIAHARAIRQRGDARTVTQSLVVEGAGRHGLFPLLKELLAELSIRSLKHIGIRCVEDWGYYLSQFGEPGYPIFPELREMDLHCLTPIGIHHAILSCNPERLQRLSVDDSEIIHYDALVQRISDISAIQQLTFPALRYLYFRLTTFEPKATAQQILQAHVTPNIQFLSVFVQYTHVPFLVHVLCQRTTTTTIAMTLQFHICAPENGIDSAHPDIMKLMAHAERYSWRVDLKFTFGTEWGPDDYD